MRRKYSVAKIMLTCLFLVMMVESVLAAPKKTLNADDNWVKGKIGTYKEVDYYKVNVPEDGDLTISLDVKSLADANLEILSADMKKSYYFEEIFKSPKESHKEKSVSLSVSKGSYIIKVSGYWFNIGDYRLKASFENFDGKDFDVHDTKKTAELLSLGQKVKGSITADQNVDFYKLVLSKKMTFSVTVWSKMKEFGFILYDDDLDILAKGEFSKDSHRKSAKLKKEYTLPAGTYYVKVLGEELKGDTFFTYKLKVEKAKKAVSGKKDSEKDKTGDVITLEKGKKATETLTLDDDDDLFTFKLDKKAKVNLELSSFMKNCQYELLDGKMDSLDCENIYGGSRDQSKKLKRHYNLKAGSYYIKISKASKEDVSLGKYLVKVKW